MTVAYAVVGILVLVVVTVDLLWTTLWADGGAGPLSSRLTSGVWRGLRRVGSQGSRSLSVAGPLILCLSLVTWVGLLWGGWTLVFAGGDPALVDTRDSGPISWAERSYFVAYTVFTMGNGDFTPTDGVWQGATSLTTASGMLFVTMAVSYVLSVLGAVVDKRTYASKITGQGDRSERFVRSGWDGEDFRNLDLLLNTLSSDIDRLAKQHKAYPILHYYHSENAEDSFPMAVAVFDEALTILRYGVPADRGPNAALVKSARSSVEGYVDTLGTAFIEPADESPPPPDLDRLRDADVPTVTDEAFDAALDDMDERRRMLLGTVTADAWDWPPATDD
ncbi:ion channel [Halosimplex amylolyticum]|uniref:ion channel n=1 Tax=Halosimplex amylolyticum TaxID=3396616 RepID=UPI003F56A318